MVGARILRIGLHLSISESIDRVINEAVERGCNTFQMFSRSPRAWKFKKLDGKTVESFKVKLDKSGLWPVFVHTPYLLNLASPKEKVYRNTVEALRDELRRAATLGVPYVVTHLGSHLGHGRNVGVSRIVEAIDEALPSAEGQVSLLLENTAGTRNSMGSSFEDIENIISKIGAEADVGVCFDTCHAFSAGYDLVSEDAVNNTLSRFDKVIGLEKLKLVHLNDSKGGLGSKIDRHEHVGMGYIGEKGFRSILKSRLGSLPLILETPIDERRSDVENLWKVRELAQI